MNNKLVADQKHGGNFYNESIYWIDLYGNEFVDFSEYSAVYEICCTQIIIFFDIFINDDIVISRNISVVYDIQLLNSVINFNTLTFIQSCGLYMCYSYNVRKSHAQKQFKMLPHYCFEVFSSKIGTITITH